MEVDNLVLANSEYLLLKQGNNFIPEIKTPITEIKQIPKFEINLSGSEIIILLLSSRTDQIFVIIQVIDSKYTILFSSEIKFKNGYTINKFWIFNFPELQLISLKESRKDELAQLYLNYKNKEIDSNFMSRLLDNFTILPDDPAINAIILDKLSIFDLKSLSLVNPDNKNKVNDYLLTKLNQKYKVNLNVNNLDQIDIFWLYPKIQEFGVTDTLVNSAANEGQLGILKWLATFKPSLSYEFAADFAAEGGHLEVLKWLATLTPSILPNKNATHLAAEGGHLEILKWLATLTPPILPTVDDADNALWKNHLVVLQWMATLAPPILPSVNRANIAASLGYLEILKWMSELNPSILPTVIGANWAAMNGHVAVLEWLKSLPPPKTVLPNFDAVEYARRYNRKEVLEWLRKNFYQYI